jgi:hypothetical protein
MHIPSLRKLKSGEFVRVPNRLFALGCCDCGLVHLVKIRIVHGYIEMALFEAPDCTRVVRETCGQDQ